MKQILGKSSGKIQMTAEKRGCDRYEDRDRLRERENERRKWDDDEIKKNVLKSNWEK